MPVFSIFLNPLALLWAPISERPLLHGWYLWHRCQVPPWVFLSRSFLLRYSWGSALFACFSEKKETMIFLRTSASVWGLFLSDLNLWVPPYRLMPIPPFFPGHFRLWEEIRFWVFLPERLSRGWFSPPRLPYPFYRPWLFPGRYREWQAFTLLWDRISVPVLPQWFPLPEPLGPRRGRLWFTYFSTWPVQYFLESSSF